MKLLVVDERRLICSIVCVLLITLSSANGQVIESDKVFEDDLYILGDEVTIDGLIKGDVVACGRVIRLNGTVEGDFIAAAQAIVITGRVDDDVRIAGQILKIDESASIGDDFIGAAFSLEFVEQGTIEADLIYAGYQALFGGDVGGDLSGAVANCEIAGHIGGDADLSVGGDPAGAQAYAAWSPPSVSMPNVPVGLTIRDAAQIGGDLTYESRIEANIESGAQITGQTRQKLPPEQSKSMAERAISFVSQYLTLLVIGICLLLIAPSLSRGVSDNIKRRPIASLGFGVAGIVGFILLLLIILAIMIALAWIAGLLKLTGLIPVIIVLGLTGGAVMVVCFWFFAGYLAKIIVSLWAGQWLLGFAKRSLSENRFFSLGVGLVLWTLATNLPYLGPLAVWLAIMVGFGGLVLWIFWKGPKRISTGKPDPVKV